ncbi:MAG: hypothetical protein M5U34_15880 [Chloroflexi bacterium]|nr:hypothetical protein [Chloroflexota bacterium]
MRNNLEVLGPVASMPSALRPRLLPLLISLLLIWIIMPFVLAALLFKRRGIL